MSTDSFEKRHIYIRSYVKLIAVYTSRNKNSLVSKEKNFQHLITNQLKYLERYRNQQELNLLFETFLEILNIKNISEIAQKTLEEYITNKSKDAILMNAILNGLGHTVCDIEVAANIYESTLLSYFANEGLPVSLLIIKTPCEYCFYFSCTKQNSDLEKCDITYNF